jgi:hypothetical protein
MKTPLMRAGSVLLVLTGSWAAATAQERIEFEGLQAGTIVDQVLGSLGSGPIFVHGSNPLLPGENAAVIFDSAEPTGGDCDLGTPNEAFFGGTGCGPAAAGPYVNDHALHNVLILDHDLQPIDGQTGVVADPDDLNCSNMFDGDCAAIANATATLSFDFGELGSVTLERLTIIDADDVGPDARIEMYGDGGGLLSSVPIPSDIPNNGVAVLDLQSTTGVVAMTVFLQGSGAIDDLLFFREEGNGDDENGDDENGDDESDDHGGDDENGDDENGDSHGDDKAKPHGTLKAPPKKK